MSRKAITLAIALVVGFFATAAQATEADRIAKLEQEVQQLREASETRYLENRRAEEVKTMVNEVLEDAESRQSLAAEGATAGWKKKFFLKSADGKYSMNITGRIQFRYIANFRDKEGNTPTDGQFDEFREGFDMARVRLEFSGNLFGDEWGYDISIAGDDGGIALDTAAIFYSPEAIEGLTLIFGIGDPTDLIVDNVMSSKRQHAVERSRVHDYFDSETSTGIHFEYEGFENIVLTGHFAQDSANWSSGGRDHYEILARADIKLMGEWKQWKDFASWSGEEAALFIGVGALIQLGIDDADDEISGAGGGEDSDWSQGIWTIDLRFEYNGFSATVAIMGSHSNVTGEGTPGESADQYGLLVQAAYNINDTVEVFVRFEYIMLDDGSNGVTDSRFRSGSDIEDPMWLTVGATYFIYKHKLKFTADVVVGLSALESSGGGGLLEDNDNDNDGQIAIRLQLQLVF